MGKEQRGATERRERECGTQEREQERRGGREWERDPQSKRRGLTGAKGGWWVSANQGVWDAKTARNSQVVKKQGAIAPPEPQARHVVTCWKAEG